MMRNISSKLFLLFILLFGFSESSLADTLIYSKKTLTILTTPPLSIEAVEKFAEEKPELPENIEGRKMPEENLVVTAPKPAKVRVSYLVKVRNVEFLNSGIINNSKFNDGEGLLIEFEAPQVMSLPIKTMFSARDIIYIDDKNIISEIFPYISNESNQNVIPIKPAKALLQINAGDTTARNIQVGDKIIFE